MIWLDLVKNFFIKMLFCPSFLEIMTHRAVAIALLVLFYFVAASAQAQDQEIGILATDSPRDTIARFEYLGDRIERLLEEYEKSRTRKDYVAIRLLIDAASDLFDLDGIPVALRGHVGTQTVTRALDELSSREQDDLQDFPSSDDLPIAGPYTFQVPGTSLWLRRMEEGSRRGEVIFDNRTVDRMTWNAALQSVDKLLGTSRHDGLTKAVAQLSGPLVPSWTSAVFSRNPSVTFFDTPRWKFNFAFSLVSISAATLWFLHRVIKRIASQRSSDRSVVYLLRPITLIAASAFLTWYLNGELYLTGRLAVFVKTANTVFLHIGFAWAAWLTVLFIFDKLASRRLEKPDSIDVNMLRLLGQITAAILFTTILTLGAQALGLPVLSILAGFGLGGLAIALAIRPTFENLIGGLILYIDRPIKVGDFCTFGTFNGTVESIGVRSTQIRALDRTLITVPNAQFADLHLVNWAACDMMQVTSVLGLRYETDMDTLRDVLSETRKMLHAHPKVDKETLRVRFAGFGDYSLNVDLRICITTREWNEFFAIREDVFFRIGEIVSSSGSDFAFPSQTVYMQRDRSVELEKVEAAHERVEAQRNKHRLPFPRFSELDISHLDGTLDYPPKGSPDFWRAGDKPIEGSEKLSAEPPESDES